MDRKRNITGVAPAIRSSQLGLCWCDPVYIAEPVRGASVQYTVVVPIERVGGMDSSADRTAEPQQHDGSQMVKTDTPRRSTCAAGLRCPATNAANGL